jgi:hypothetical protein
MSLPYQDATGDPTRARGEIIKVLQRFGAESVGFMDEFNTRTLILQFTWRGRQIQLRASAQGWANAYLKENPWNYRRAGTRTAYEMKAVEQGTRAINSILRDWVKGQMTAIETGILSFEQVFFPFMLAHDGRSVLDHINELKLLPAPEKTDG